MSLIRDVVDMSAWYPYQKACGYESQVKVEDTEAKFRSKLYPSVLTFWVKSEPNKDDTEEDEILEYELKFRHDATILDIIAKIREQEGMDETIELKVIYADETLDEGKTLAYYRKQIDRESENWSPPYAGVLWIAADGHVASKERRKTVPLYYANEDVAGNIFHRRQKG